MANTSAGSKLAQIVYPALKYFGDMFPSRVNMKLLLACRMLQSAIPSMSVDDLDGFQVLSALRDLIPALRTEFPAYDLLTDQGSAHLNRQLHCLCHRHQLGALVRGRQHYSPVVDRTTS